MTNNIDSEEEIRLKDVINGIKGFVYEIKRNWLWLVVLAAIFVAINVFLTLSEDATYPASFTFMVNEEEGGSSGGMGSILSNFGLGGGGGGEYNLDKIKELSKTRRIIQEAIFEKVSIDGNDDFIANHLIQEYDLQEKWKENSPELKDFIFTNKNFDSFSRVENRALKSLHYKVRGNDELNVSGIMSIAFEGATGIFDMQVSSTKEELSIKLLEALFDKLSSFYINGAIEKPKSTFLNLKVQVDSLQKVLNSKEYQLAKNVDSNKGLIARTAQLTQDRLRRDVQLLTIEYSKNLEQLKLAEFALKNATPFFQVIDRPIAPIKAKEGSLIKAIVIGITLGVFLGLVFFIIRKIIRDALEE